VPVWTAAIDSHLNDHGYIVPGLEDVLAGLAEIERGELASPDEVEASFRSFG
jgi:predicted transcriptional regulator